MPTPEALAFVEEIWHRKFDARRADVAEWLDRFAAQRGAEAEERFRQLLEAASTFEWKAEGAPPQTGGGDAGERACAIIDLIAAQPGCRIDPHARDYAAKLIADFHREGADLKDDMRGGGPEYFRAALLESRREGCREGAEAMREDCKRAARGEDANRGAANEIAAAYIQGRLDAVSDIRALPIPGKTDAN